MACAYCSYRPLRSQGFTLVELVAVIVILGIVSALGSGFLIRTLDSAMLVENRSSIVQRGNMLVEQMSRPLRMAAPNSIRVSSTGKCIEFLPTVTVTNYQATVPDQNNGMSGTTSIATGTFSFNFGQANQVLLARLYTCDIYTAANPSSRVAIGTLGAGPSYTAVPLASSHIFLRNSPSNRIYITDKPERFCLIGTTLIRYSQYGFLTATLDDTNPGGSSDIFGENISTASTLFNLSIGSEDRNTAIRINFTVTKGKGSLAFNHEVLIRNVP